MGGATPTDSPPTPPPHAVYPNLLKFVDEIFNKVSQTFFDNIHKVFEPTNAHVKYVKGPDATGNETASVREVAQASRATAAVIPIVVEKYTGRRMKMTRVQLQTTKAGMASNFKIKMLEDKITELKQNCNITIKKITSRLINKAFMLSRQRPRRMPTVSLI